MNQQGPINPAAVYGSVDELNARAAEAATAETDYDSGDVDGLLITLVNNLPLSRRVASWLDPRYLVTFLRAEPWQEVIWLTLRDLLLQSADEDPSPGYLARSAYHAAVRLYGDETIGQTASVAVDEMAKLKPMKAISEKILEDIYARYVMGPDVQSLMMEARETQDWTNVIQRLDDLSNKRLQSLVDEERTKNVDAFGVLDMLDTPLEEGAEEEDSPRIGTGVSYIDALHARGSVCGLYRGFTTLIAGPTGGGKTVVNYELVSALTAQHLSVGMFATEEDPSSHEESRARLFAACTDITTREWQDARCDPRRLKVLSGKELPPAQIDRLRQMRRFLKIYRMEPVSWASLTTELENYYLLNDNTMHDVVVIDWAGPLATDMVALGECQSMHEALERICMWATQKIAGKYNCAVVVFHQLADAAVAKKGIYGKYGKGDTQNCHKMSQHCAAMHVITPHDPRGRARYCAVKARFDKEDTEVLIQLDPMHGRFADISEVFEVRAGRFVTKESKEDGSHKMPDTKKARFGEAAS